MTIETDKKLVFYGHDKKRFSENEVESVLVLPSASNYENLYRVKLHDGDEVIISDRQIMDSHDNPKFLFAAIVEPSE